MELNEVLKKRRSIRHYTKEKVPRSALGELIEAASFSPVSCNLQLTQYVIVDDESLLRKLSKEVSYKFNYSPCSIVVLHDSRFSIERFSGVMTAGMAVENLLLKATEIGLGTCAMAGFESDEKIKEILGIPIHMDILLIISMGYIDHSFKMLEIPKLGITERYNFNNYHGLFTFDTSKDFSNQSVCDVVNYRKRISPVYLDRLRLNTYNVSYYNDVFSFLSRHLNNNKNKKILDLVSYDGVFLNTVYESNIKNIEVTPSDYLKNNIEFFNKKFGYSGVLIDSNNNIESEESFDFITFVFQINFTPDLSTLLNSANSRLRKGGMVFVSVVRESWYRRLAKRIKIFKLKIIGKEVNIYENNPYYKIGLVRNYSKKQICKLFNKIGYRTFKYDCAKKKMGVSLEFYIFQKE